jgi:predicted RNase H-like HicB family nuclease
LQYIKLTMIFHKEDKQWVGTCQELGTSTFSDTIDEVKTELIELVELQLNALEDLDERKRFFEEQGIEIIAKEIPQTINVSVPYSPDLLIQPFFKNLGHVYS